MCDTVSKCVGCLENRDKSITNTQFQTKENGF